MGYMDAVCYIPKKDILFFGFGMMSAYHNFQIRVKVNWKIGEYEY